MVFTAIGHPNESLSRVSMYVGWIDYIPFYEG